MPNRNFVSRDLVTIDATVPHPGFDPFADFRRERELKCELSTLGLNLAQKLAVGILIKNPKAALSHIALPPRAQQIVAELAGGAL